MLLYGMFLNTVPEWHAMDRETPAMGSVRRATNGQPIAIEDAAIDHVLLGASQASHGIPHRTYTDA